MGLPGHSSTTSEDPDLTRGLETSRTLKHFPPYGSMGGSSTGDICPTCRGTGRIPRDQEDKLVAVIPCNDVRLKPRRSKLYACISVGVILLVCCLILFFLFPRSINITPVSLLSVMVYFTPDTVEMEVTNLINVSNDNFVPVQIVDFTIQSVVGEISLRKTKISNMTAIPARSQKAYTIQIDLHIADKSLNYFCKLSSTNIHRLFLELQMTMNISYLSHVEQVSLDTYEYIDCGTNTTTPRPLSR